MAEAEGRPATVTDVLLDGRPSPGLEIRPFDTGLAVAAGLLRTATRGQGLPLGDRACVALAIREQARGVTADRAWAALDLGVEVEPIR